MSRRSVEYKGLRIERFRTIVMAKGCGYEAEIVEGKRGPCIVTNNFAEAEEFFGESRGRCIIAMRKCKLDRTLQHRQTALVCNDLRFGEIKRYLQPLSALGDVSPRIPKEPKRPDQL